MVAFNAGNLTKVAQVIRDENPDLPITMAADNDRMGLEMARKAAHAVSCDLIYPDFTELEVDGTDFNDYVVSGGEL